MRVIDARVASVGVAAGVVERGAGAARVKRAVSAVDRALGWPVEAQQRIGRGRGSGVAEQYSRKREREDGKQ